MFKRGCNKCGEFWYIGNPSTCKCQTNDQPKREWVSLTDEDKAQLIWKDEDKAQLIWKDVAYLDFETIEAIEAKLKELNT